jgi:tripartite-type tricarboxylate transporter receptor subunit TctC
MELLKQQAGLDIVHVRTRTVGALTDLLGGQINAMFLPVHTALPPTRAGQIRLLGVSLPNRHPLFPEFPSLDEQGVRGLDVDLWFGVWGPANLPPEVASKYNREIRDIVANPRCARRSPSRDCRRAPARPRAGRSRQAAKGGRA